MTADPDATNDEGAPLLQQAMLRQDRGKFRNLLAAGANPAQGNADGQTALHLAAMGKDQYLLDQLLERGVGPDLPNTRPAERRVGKEGVGKCKTQGSQYN